MVVGSYTISDSVFNNRPVYAGNDGVYGFWFYAKSKAWMYGKLANMDLNKSDRGLLYSKGHTCPNLNTKWNEWWNNGWTVGRDLVVECAPGMTHVMTWPSVVDILSNNL